VSHPFDSDARPRSGCLGMVLAVLTALLLAAVLAASLSVETDPEPSSWGNRAGSPSTRVAELIPPIGFEVTTTSSSSTTTTTRPPSSELGIFRVTCYGPPLFPAGQGTASGRAVGPGSIAVDPGLIRLGTKLEVRGYGRGVANDTGSKVRGRHVDVWVADPTPCPWSRAAVRVVRA
jgi:3D (Asp-Asp-Asp) domain-containing protein